MPQSTSLNHQKSLGLFVWCTEGYKSANDEQRVEDVWLEGEESQTHVGEDEVLRQEVQQLKQLLDKRQEAKQQLR